MITKKEVISYVIYKQLPFTTDINGENYYFSNGQIIVCYIPPKKNTKHFVEAKLKNLEAEEVYQKEFETFEELEEIISEIRKLKENIEIRKVFRSIDEEIKENREDIMKIEISNKIYSLLESRKAKKYGIENANEQTYKKIPVQKSCTVERFKIVRKKERKMTI